MLNSIYLQSPAYNQCHSTYFERILSCNPQLQHSSLFSSIFESSFCHNSTSKFPINALKYLLSSQHITMINVIYLLPYVTLSHPMPVCIKFPSYIFLLVLLIPTPWLLPNLCFDHQLNKCYNILPNFINLREKIQFSTRIRSFECGIAFYALFGFVEIMQESGQPKISIFLYYLVKVQKFGFKFQNSPLNWPIVISSIKILIRPYFLKLKPFSLNYIQHF